MFMLPDLVLEVLYILLCLLYNRTVYLQQVMNLLLELTQNPSHSSTLTI